MLVMQIPVVVISVGLTRGQEELRSGKEESSPSPALLYVRTSSAIASLMPTTFYSLAFSGTILSFDCHVSSLKYLSVGKYP